MKTVDNKDNYEDNEKKKMILKIYYWRNEWNDTITKVGKDKFRTIFNIKNNRGDSILS